MIGRMVVGILVAFSVASGTFAADQDDASPPTIHFQRETHFYAPDGKDIALPTGAYTIDLGEGPHIWLTSEQTKDAVELATEPITHDLEIKTDVAILVPGEEERTHLVVLFADKTGLDAVGFPSAARPRGTGLIRVNPSVLRQSAAAFSRPSVQAPVLAAPPQAPPVAPGGAVPKGAKTSGPSTIQVGEPRWVTWSYLRMNDPQGVARILRDVQAGQLPPTTLNGLASPPALTEMMKTNWAAEVARLDARRPAQAAPGSPGGSSGTGIRPRGIAGSGGGAFSPLTTTPRFAEAPLPLQQAMRSLSVEPARLDFGGLYFGQVRRQQVNLTVSKDGEVSVAAPPNAAFRIISFESYTGGFRPVVHQPTGSGSIATMGARAELVPEVDKKRTAAPFRLPVRAGQGLSVLVEFSPKKELGVAEGLYQTAVQIQATLFEKGQAIPEQINVPVRAQINGFLFGADARPLTGNSSILPEQDFLVEFDFTNEGQASEATLEIANLPPGFTSNVPAIRMSLAKGESRRSGFVLRASPAARGPGGSPEEKWLSFKFSNGPNSWTLDYPVYIYPTWVRFPFTVERTLTNSGSARNRGTLDLRGDGWFRFQGEMMTTGSGLNDTIHWGTSFTLNQGGFKREVTGQSEKPYYDFDVQGSVLELAQDFIRTLNAGFRLDLSLAY